MSEDSEKQVNYMNYQYNQLIDRMNNEKAVFEEEMKALGIIVISGKS